MQRRDLNAPDVPPPVAAYTHAIEVTGATRTLYISGQVGQRMDGTIPPDIVEQSRLAWQNLEAQLKAAGMTLDNLVNMTTILPNHGDLAAAREARSKALGDRKPASTLIVGGLANPAWKSRSRASPSLYRGDAHAGSKAEMDIDWTLSLLRFLIDTILFWFLANP